MSQVNPAIGTGIQIAAAEVKQRRGILYQREYRLLAQSVTGAIFLKQMFYWWTKSGMKEFYKFRAPCDHAAYRHGDSWCEELAFSPAEFDTARRAVATKVTKGRSKDACFLGQVHDDFRRALVVFYTDGARKTWWQINARLFGAGVWLAYNLPDVLERENIPVVLPQKRAFFDYFPERETVLRLIERGAGFALELTTEKENPRVEFADLASAGDGDEGSHTTDGIDLSTAKDWLDLAGMTRQNAAVAVPQAVDAGVELFLVTFERHSGQGKIEEPRRSQWARRLGDELKGLKVAEYPDALDVALRRVLCERKYAYINAPTPFATLFNEAWRGEFRALRQSAQRAETGDIYGV